MLGGMETPRSSHRIHRTLAIGGIVLLFLLLLLLSGCAFPTHAKHRSSSVVQFLYPDGEQPFVKPQIPTLRLPLRVGVAFVPATHITYTYTTEAFPPTLKQTLMQEVSQQFETLPFVAHIEEIPSIYLRPGGSFENLDQIRSLLGVDVIALISYDQAQGAAQDDWAFAYWTIVGAYVINATENETHTLMEAVVYDIESRSLLFRAPGASVIKDHSTLIDSEENLQEDSVQGFNKAAQDLTLNLADQLHRFQMRLKEEPDIARIERRPGYTGAGSLSGAWVLAMSALLWGRRFFPSRT
jgi:rhombotail lipoprotein